MNAFGFMNQSTEKVEEKAEEEKEDEDEDEGGITRMETTAENQLQDTTENQYEYL